MRYTPGMLTPGTPIYPRGSAALLWLAEHARSVLAGCLTLVLVLVAVIVISCTSHCAGPTAPPEPTALEREDCEWRDAAGAHHLSVECWEHWAAVEAAQSVRVVERVAEHSTAASEPPPGPESTSLPSGEPRHAPAAGSTPAH